MWLFCFLSGWSTLGIFTGCMGAIAKYFVYNRTIASGIAFSGGSIGMVVFPFLFQACMEAFTLRGLLLVYAGFILNFMVTGFLVGAMERQPSDNNNADIGNHEMKNTKTEEKIQDSESQSDTCNNTNIELKMKEPATISKDYTPTKCQAFKKFWRPFLGIKFLACSLYYCAYVYGVLGFLFYIPPYLAELGLSQIQIISIMAVNGALDFLSRLGIGFIARLPRTNIYILIAVTTTIAGCFDISVPLMLRSGSPYAVMVGNLAVVGLFVGGLLGLINQLIVEAVGIDRAGTGSGSRYWIWNIWRNLWHYSDYLFTSLW